MRASSLFAPRWSSRVWRAGLIIALAILTLAPSRAAAEPDEVVRDSAYVDVGDTRLHLEIRGRAGADTVLLFLHGGPGTAAGLLTFAAYPGPLLETEYLVAYLSQRGVLRSPSVPNRTQTVASHIADVNRIVTHLRERFPGRRLVLVGHSWGGLLALLYVQAHSEAPADGLVLIAAPLSLSLNEAARHDVALGWARRTGNSVAIVELGSLCPPPYTSVEKLKVHRRWLDQAMPPSGFTPSETRILSAGGFDAMYPEWESTARQIAATMFRELMATDVRPGLSGLRTPLLAIAGGRDGVVIAGAMIESLATYGGPKRTVVFADGDHLLYMQEPGRLTREITSFTSALPARN